MTAHEGIVTALNVVIVKSINRLRHLALGIIRSLKNWFIEFINRERESGRESVGLKFK